jgi:hypothetical protein
MEVPAVDDLIVSHNTLKSAEFVQVEANKHAILLY